MKTQWKLGIKIYNRAVLPLLPKILTLAKNKVGMTQDQRLATQGRLWKVMVTDGDRKAVCQ